MTDLATLHSVIDGAFERRAELNPRNLPADVGAAIDESIELLDSGRARVAEPKDGRWVVNEWLKKAVLLYFRSHDNVVMDAGYTRFYDKVPLKYAQATELDLKAGGARVVPHAVVRKGSYIAPNVVLMPSYVNIGAHVGSGTMVDTWATVGSCAQIGRNVHLSGGVGIGGVLEPPNARPVVIEDEALIGSRAMITEGARVGRGAVVGAGVILNPSIPVIDAETGEEISRGHIPPWSVAVTGTRYREFPGGTFGLPCVLVIKRLTEGERHGKAQLNDILRAHGLAT